MTAGQTVLMPAAVDPHDVVFDDVVNDVAAALVNSGRVVPGIAFDGDRVRSWWWPLPAAGQRQLVATLVTDSSEDAQRVAAQRLAVAVDTLVRARLIAAGVTAGPHRRGRTPVTESWRRALCATDPYLPPSVDRDAAGELIAAVTSWARSGAVLDGQARLCLRVREPDNGSAVWTVELLVQDRDEPSLQASLADVWSGATPFRSGTIREVLASLARLARLAPELAGVLEEERPASITVTADDVLRLLRDRVQPLDDAGIAVLLPTWWSRRPRLGVRARTRRSGPTSRSRSGGLGLDTLVSFTWEAALGEQRLSKADLANLSRAAATKQTLVRVRGQWTEVSPAQVAALLAANGTASAATGADLLRAGLGLTELAVGEELEVVGVDASSTGWLHALLDVAHDATVEPVPAPPGFVGELRPYQERGVGWLGFLGRLSLGACLADDMGLGKTPQMIAALLAAGADRPSLVVCPVSVLGNWSKELAALCARSARHAPLRPGPPERRRHVRGERRRPRRGADVVFGARP